MVHHQDVLFWDEHQTSNITNIDRHPSHGITHTVMAHVVHFAKGLSHTLSSWATGTRYLDTCVAVCWTVHASSSKNGNQNDLLVRSDDSKRPASQAMFGTVWQQSLYWPLTTQAHDRHSNYIQSTDISSSTGSTASLSMWIQHRRCKARTWQSGISLTWKSVILLTRNFQVGLNLTIVLKVLFWSPKLSNITEVDVKLKKCLWSQTQ